MQQSIDILQNGDDIKTIIRKHVDTCNKAYIFCRMEILLNQ